MKKTILFLLAAALTTPLLAKHNGDYLNKMTQEYTTPHYKFQSKPEAKKLRVLFILARSGARDAVEVVQRMPMEAEYFLTYGPSYFAKEDMYESTIDGTTMYEKEKELSEKLNKGYDVCVIGTFDFMKLPESAQFQLLNAVTKGMGLVFAYPATVKELPYKKLYQHSLAIPESLMKFARPAPKMLMQAWQVGAGRLVNVSWKEGYIPVDRSVLPPIPYSNQWKTQNENAAAFFCAVCRFAAGKELTVKNPQTRIRDLWNKDVTNLRILPGGTYYRDEMGENGAFQVTEFSKPSPVGTVSVKLPEAVKNKEPFSGTVSVSRPVPEALKVEIELQDSPYGRVWFRQEVTLPANAKEVNFTLKDYYMPTLAGYVRASVKVGKNTCAIGDKEIFFPDPSLDDYTQLGWDTLTANNGELLGPQLLGRLGWNYGLTHPKTNGANIRDIALLNQKFFSYTVRVMVRKSPKGGVIQPNWFFLPSALRPQQKALNQDECFYRPEVKKLWSESIAHRVKNLPKYSTAIYALGDENELELEAGYGPSDLVWFRNFLKEKYKTIEALNYNYRSAYRSFDEVPHTPLKEAKESGKFPAWADHRAYMEKMYADIHAFLRDEIRKHDPGAKVGAEGSVPGNLEETIERLEYWGPYSDLLNDELLRSIGGDKVRMLWWGGYPGSHSGRGRYAAPLLKDLLLGTVNGNAWFAANPGSNHSSFGCDLTIAAYVRNYLEDMDRMRNGSAQLLIRNPLTQTGLAFYWSHPSAAAALLAPACGNPSDGISPLIRMAYRTGLGFEFITAKTIDRLKSAKAVFLCGASALSRKECDALLDFVRNGGTLIADANPAMMNENLRVMEKNPLAELFGNITFANAPVGTTGKLDIPGLRAARVPMYSRKLFTEKRYGKGKAILCNFSLASAYNTADTDTPFDTWVLSLLKKAGVSPVFTVGRSDENAMTRVRSGRDFTLLGVMMPEKQMKKTVNVDLKKNYYVYEADRGFAGVQNKLAVTFDKSPLKLYTLFNEKQSAPDFSIAPAKQGEMLKFGLPKLVSGRVYRLELCDPSGNPVWSAVFDREEKRPARPVSYSEPAGTWSAKLTDVATGLSKNIKFEVKK